MGFKVPRHAVDYCFESMHACLLHIYNHALLHLLFIVIYHEGSVKASCMCNFILIKTDFSSCLHHPFGYVPFFAF
jgi:hypothetical protein